jgi:hypothetical protein
VLFYFYFWGMGKTWWAEEEPNGTQNSQKMLLFFLKFILAHVGVFFSWHGGLPPCWDGAAWRVCQRLRMLSWPRRLLDDGLLARLRRRCWPQESVRVGLGLGTRRGLHQIGDPFPPVIVDPSARRDHVSPPVHVLGITGTQCSQCFGRRAGFFFFFFFFFFVVSTTWGGRKKIIHKPEKSKNRHIPSRSDRRGQFGCQVFLLATHGLGPGLGASSPFGAARPALLGLGKCTFPLGLGCLCPLALLGFPREPPRLLPRRKSRTRCSPVGADMQGKGSSEGKFSKKKKKKSPKNSKTQNPQPKPAYTHAPAP